MKTTQYYDIKPLLEKNCPYSMVFSKRSNGKTFSSLNYVLENYFKAGEKAVYLRRWDIDIIGARASKLVSDFNRDNIIYKMSGGLYEGLHYWAHKIYPCVYDDNGKAVYRDNDAIMDLLSLNNFEHDKSTGGYADVTTIIFDEFISSRGYIDNEYVLFCNVLSTIIRGKDNVRIIMLGNTINPYCPYFKEMGLVHISQMKKGDIDIYDYNNPKLRVAVEYGSDFTGNRESDFYFAFDNPKLRMITHGDWEIGYYPHCTVSFHTQDIILRYFILFDGKKYECQIVSKNSDIFTFIFESKNKEIPDNVLVYSLENSESIWYNTSIHRYRNETERKILWFYMHDKVFYSDNAVGNAIEQFMGVSK